MTKRSKAPLHFRRVTCSVAIASAVVVLLVSNPAAAADEAVPSGPPVQTTDDRPVERTRLGAYLRLPLTYTLLRGNEFDGRHAGVLDANRTIHLPRISGGFGFKPSLGLKIDHLTRYLGVMTGAAFAFSKHRAISYNFGDTYYDRSDSTFYELELEVRAIAELGRFKPFLAVDPGLSWLTLPNGITTLDARCTAARPPAGIQCIVSWSDVTLRGVSLEMSLGALYEVFEELAVDASIGYRIQQLTSSSAGSFSGFGLSPGWEASLGFVLSVQ